MALPMGTAPPKPGRGEALLERRHRRRETVAYEQREMRAAKRRDENKCRRPRCQFLSMKLPIDACHRKDQHRGLGGNPAKTRTLRKDIVCLCRGDHGLYDAGELRIEPLTEERFDNVCAFYERNKETGKFEHIGTETRRGVSVTRDGR